MTKEITGKLVKFFALAIFFILANQAKAATESIAIVRPDCANKSISTADCYTSLASWEIAEQKDLVAADEISSAQIEGNWTSADTTALFLSGWTTDATRYIKIYTTDEARHSGVWDDSKYRLESDSSVLYLSEENVKVDGLQIRQTDSSNNSRHGIRLSPLAQSNYYLSNNIIKGNSATTGFFSHGITTTTGFTGSYIYLWNNIIYDFESDGTGTGINLGNNHISYLYNNTINNCHLGIYHVTTTYAKNNIVQNTASNSYGGLTSFETSSDYNISDDTTDTGGTNDKTSQSVSFISTIAGSEDFHLQASDVSAIDAGTDLSSDSMISFSTDIDGASREETWDIGADEQNNNMILRSDVDNSSSVTTTDAMLTLRNSLGLDMSITAWVTSITTGDVNCDGSSNTADAMLILRKSLNLDMSGTAWCEV